MAARIRNIEQKYGPLEQFLPEMVQDLGATRTANLLGVSRGLVYYWMSRKPRKDRQKELPKSPAPLAPKVIRLRPEDILEMKPIVKKEY